MLLNKLLEAFIGGNVFLDCGNLFAGNVFGEVAAVHAALEVEVRMAVGICSDDGEVAALHAGNRGHLRDTFG